MKTGLFIGFLTFSIVAGIGCSSTSSESIVAKDTQNQAWSVERTIWEINAVSRMSFDEDRQRALREIARRAPLDERVQTHLIKAVFDHLAFEAAKEDVLLTLIRNPGFNGAGREAILGRIHLMAFENDKQEILEALYQRKI